MSDLRVAIVSDQLATPGGLGGAERFVLELHALFPDAPIFTTVYNPERMGSAFEGLDVRTSWVDRLPLARKRHGAFLPLMPLAIESLDLRDYDLVISSHHSVAHGVLTRSDALHISYCHSPMRYAWDLTSTYLQTLPGPARGLASAMLSVMRHWDAVAGQRVDHFIANSRYVAGRVRRAYRRDAEVIHPPVLLRTAPPDPSLGRFFLVVSRLVPYKRIDLAVAACNQLEAPLVIIGEGPELKRLKAMAGPTVTFLGRQSDETVVRYMASCEALLFPGCEDFGMTPVEVMAAGRPVVAFAAGGALETVVPGKTGCLFDRQEVSSLVEALHEVRAIDWDARVLQRHAEGFGKAAFRERFLDFLEGCLARQAGHGPLVGSPAWVSLLGGIGQTPASLEHSIALMGDRA